jgi:hypothetical protein
MNVGELKENLAKFPDHYTVQAVLVGREIDDKTADFVDVFNNIQNKIVWLELDGPLTP